MGGETFGLEEDLVRVFVGKAVNFVFYRRAIAWPHALDYPGKHGASI